MTDQNTFAIDELQQKANNGDAQAQFDLALCYANGTAIEKNEELAFNWHKKAAEQGHVNAQFALGLYYFLGKDRVQQTGKLVNKWVFGVATGKNVDPALNLAVSQALAKNLSGADNELAFVWLKSAAEQNHAEANYWLGICYRDGIGTQQNDVLAFESFRIAAEQGFAEAYYWLALYYRDGNGIEQNNELALEWITKAVEHADDFFRFNEYGSDYGKSVAEAFLFLGDLYAYGRCVEQSDEQALMWYEKAAEKDVAEAQYCLANFYLIGKGVAKNYELAMEWFDKAATQGHAEAKNLLAKHYSQIANNLYFGENGFENNVELAFEWCTKAAKLGSTSAYLLLGYLYAFGTGVEQSDKLAFECYKKAAEHFENVEGENLNKMFANKFLADCYAQGKGVEKSEELAEQHYQHVDRDKLNQKHKEAALALVMESTPKSRGAKEILPLRLAIHNSNKEYDSARQFVEGFYENIDGSDRNFKNICLTYIDQAEELDKKNQQLEEKNRELNNIVAMFAHNFLGTLQCIRSNAEHENNPAIHLKTVKMMGGALTAFSILSADDDKLVEQLKQDNTGEMNLQQNLANNLALAISQLLGKTNKDKIVNLYLQHLSKTKQIETETTSEELRINRDYRKMWQALQHQWEDDFNALFSENVDLPRLQKWITDNFCPVEITGFDSYNISFREYGITDSIFLIVFMEIFVNAFKYMDVNKKEPLILKFCEENQFYKLVCENPSSQETGRGTHKGMDFLKTIAKKLGGQFITEVTGNSFKSTFAIPSELLK